MAHALRKMLLAYQMVTEVVGSDVESLYHPRALTRLQQCGEKLKIQVREIIIKLSIIVIIRMNKTLRKIK